MLRLFPKEGLKVEGRVHETVSSPFPHKNCRGLCSIIRMKTGARQSESLTSITEYLCCSAG